MLTNNPIDETIEPTKKVSALSRAWNAVKETFNRIQGNTVSLNFLQTLTAILFALLIGAGLILVVGESPLRAYAALLDGAFGGVPAVLRSIRMASPLIMTSLAVLVAFRAGMINLGIEGALYLGALAGALAGIYLPLPYTWLHLPVALLFGAVVGGLWSFIPGFLKARYKVDEIVATLMLNYIAILLVDFLVHQFFMDPALGTTSDRPATMPVLPTARLPVLSDKYGLTISILIGLFLVFLFAWLYRRSVWGFESEMTGLNSRFARFGGIPVQKVAVLSMTISGMLAGLAGAMESLGPYGRYISGFSTGLGFDGMTVALMGRLSPIGSLFGALFIGGLKNGGAAMELDVNVTRDLVTVIQGLILAIVTAQTLFILLRLGSRTRPEE